VLLALNHTVHAVPGFNFVGPIASMAAKNTSFAVTALAKGLASVLGEGANSLGTPIGKLESPEPWSAFSQSLRARLRIRVR
jgi:hypothetical protein